MNEKSFLKEIVGIPSDDEPRLVFADWLTDRGDPRGEFIHLQIRRESLDPASPRAQESRRVERELIKQHGVKWSNGVHAITPRYEFRRGFVSEVGLSLKKFLEEAKSLAKLAPFDVLGVRQCNSSRIMELAESRQLSKIKSLKLVKCTADGESLETLFNAPKFRLSHFLVDSDSVFDTEMSRVFANSLCARKLQSLRLQQYQTTPDMASIVTKLKQLRLLVCQASASEAAVLAESKLPIESLGLGGEIGRIGCEAIARSKRLRKLKALDLCGTFDAVGGRALAEIGMPKLERLNVRRHDLDDDSIKTVVKKFPSLCYLDILQNSRLTPACIPHLANSPFLGQLRCLRLGPGKGVGRRDVMALAKSPHFSGESKMLQFPLMKLSSKIRESLENELGKGFLEDVYGDWQMRRDSFDTLPLLPLPCELP